MTVHNKCKGIDPGWSITEGIRCPLVLAYIKDEDPDVEIVHKQNEKKMITKIKRIIREALGSSKGFTVERVRGYYTVSKGKFTFTIDTWHRKDKLREDVLNHIEAN